MSIQDQIQASLDNPGLFWNQFNHTGYDHAWFSHRNPNSSLLCCMLAEYDLEDENWFEFIQHVTEAHDNIRCEIDKKNIQRLLLYLERKYVVDIEPFQEDNLKQIIANLATTLKRGVVRRERENGGDKGGIKSA